MKKVLAGMIAVVLMVALTACGGSPAGGGTPGGGAELDLTPSPDLSENLFDFEIQIDGVVYPVPCPVSFMLENGWEPRDGLDFTMEPYTFTANSIVFVKDGFMLYTHLLNSSEGKTLPAEECELADFEFDTDDAEAGVAVVLPGGLTFGASYEECIAAYGEPSSVFGDPVNFIEYEPDAHQAYTGMWTLHFDDDNNLEEVRVKRELA